MRAELCANAACNKREKRSRNGKLRSMARIPYVDPSTITDPEIRAFIEEAERVGTPRPEVQLIRAHVPSVIRSFVYTWKSLFKSGIVDHKLKELLRLRVARSLD